MPTSKPNKARRWPEAERDEFDKLTSDLALQEVETGIPFPFDPSSYLSSLFSRSLPTRGLLSGATLSELAKTPPDPEVQRKERLAALWKRVKEHPTFKRLHSDPNFKAAHKVFRAKQRRSPGRYAEEYAELRFLNIVASIVTHHESFPNVRPKFPSLATVEKADRHITALLKCLDEGVRLEKWPDDNNLRAALVDLRAKLESERLSSRARRPRGDGMTGQRWYIDGLIGQLHSALGEASNKIVANVAAMMGYSIDPSTIDRRKSEVLKAKARQSPTDRQPASRT